VDISAWPVPLKRAFWWFGDRFMVDPHLVPALNSLRADLDLAPVHRPFTGWLNSPDLVIGLFPDWFGGSPPDWPPQLRQVGFPLYDEADVCAPDEKLEAFLREHEPGGGPIALTPGSANRHGREFFAAGLAAARELGRAVICLTAFPEQLPDPLPDHAFHTSYAPFSRVFPRCSAVAHHGGIGTLGQALAAGVPHLVMPLGFDQPDNAARLKNLGVGDWLAPDKFEAAAVAAKLDALIGSAEVVRACARRRDELAGRDAVGTACELLEELGTGQAT
jgi:UDP:flavonoid glycosyltransferase YjiC (YdhE family)